MVGLPRTQVVTGVVVMSLRDTLVIVSLETTEEASERAKQEFVAEVVKMEAEMCRAALEEEAMGCLVNDHLAEGEFINSMKMVEVVNDLGHVATMTQKQVIQRAFAERDRAGAAKFYEEAQTQGDIQ